MENQPTQGCAQALEKRIRYGDVYFESNIPVRRPDPAAVVDIPRDGGEIGSEQVTDRCTNENDVGALSSEQDVDVKTNENEDCIAVMLKLNQGVREVEEQGQYEEI